MREMQAAKNISVCWKKEEKRKKLYLAVKEAQFNSGQNLKKNKSYL